MPKSEQQTIVAPADFTPNLQRHLTLDPCEVPGHSLSEILRILFARHEKLEGCLLDDQGELRKHMNIFIDGISIQDRRTQSDSVNSNSEVYIAQALSGG
jgi:molybdopterin synthase sulfur carrier subunit